MTPEREQQIRKYTESKWQDPWPAVFYLDEVLEALDAERERNRNLGLLATAHRNHTEAIEERNAKLERVVEVARTWARFAIPDMDYLYDRELAETLAALEETE